MACKKLKCRSCDERKDRETMLTINGGNYCGMECVIAYASKNKDKGRVKLVQHEKRELANAKQKVKTRGEWAKEAQAEYNRFERASRPGESCYTCDAPDDGSRQFHCGHYLTRGARPEHRFNHDNTRKQCSRCNNFLSGNVAVFRERLIKEIGVTRVEAMECDHEPKKYTIDELKEIKERYREKWKLEK